MKKTTRFHPQIAVGAVGQAGGVLLAGTAETNGLATELGGVDAVAQTVGGP